MPTRRHCWGCCLGRIQVAWSVFPRTRSDCLAMLPGSVVRHHCKRIRAVEVAGQLNRPTGTPQRPDCGHHNVVIVSLLHPVRSAARRWGRSLDTTFRNLTRKAGAGQFLQRQLLQALGTVVRSSLLAVVEIQQRGRWPAAWSPSSCASCCGLVVDSCRLAQRGVVGQNPISRGPATVVVGFPHGRPQDRALTGHRPPALGGVAS